MGAAHCYGCLLGTAQAHWAAYRSHLGVLRILHAMGARMDEPDNKGFTPLLLTLSEQGFLSCSTYLITECGVNTAYVNDTVPDQFRLSIVDTTLGCLNSDFLGENVNQRKLVKLLSTTGTSEKWTKELNCDADSAGWQTRADLKFVFPVHAVAQWHNTEGIEALAAAGLSLRTRDNRSAHGMCSNFDSDEDLTIGGTSDNVCGGEPLHHAAKRNNVEMIEWLLSRRVPIDATDDHGGTALHWAVAFGALDAARYLLENGASATAVDNHGRSVQFWAAHSDLVDATLQNQIGPLLSEVRTPKGRQDGVEKFARERAMAETRRCAVCRYRLQCQPSGCKRPAQSTLRCAHAP
jgi:hypothetical protein